MDADHDMTRPDRDKAIATAIDRTPRRLVDDQIAERLAWTPRECLAYLLDMLEFEERAHRARALE